MTTSARFRRQWHKPPQTSGSVRLINVCIGLCATIFILVLFGLMSLGVNLAYGIDDIQSPNSEWFKGLKSKAGIGCCDGGDGLRLEDPDWRMTQTGYRVRLDGEWMDVPAESLVTDPNRVGVAIVWPYLEGGVRKIRCFMPGAGG